jgi:hypothetical protein
MVAHAVVNRRGHVMVVVETQNRAARRHDACRGGGHGHGADRRDNRLMTGSVVMMVICVLVMIVRC